MTTILQRCLRPPLTTAPATSCRLIGVVGGGQRWRRQQHWWMIVIEINKAAAEVALPELSSLGFMGSRVTTCFFVFMIFLLLALPSPPHPRLRSPKVPHRPPYHSHPPSQPQHGKERCKVSPPTNNSPVPPVIVPLIIIIYPPVITPPVTNPPVTIPPPSSTYPPYTSNPPSRGSSGGGGLTPPSGGGSGLPRANPPPSTSLTCPINALKLGLCLDVLSGLVHVGLGNLVENACCSVLGDLLEIEAVVCLCNGIRLRDYS
ncbi:PREDICTED: 36.4 kDa proline-rich protein-like [Nelumbo nucifera]|uniref:36.4 kDa proline-rich protein-like n=2 Tax=Nelumbo nucifera TaxID=4432 RepID=A0A1U8B005_NELNU|nr:PREDICTED: 36.4 kDa proline-rich protein-like [Nelumbo nucifera]DAD49143.1 TPA_asm: hypothetical protein HUJ06_019080 [Nelumbo nucifera]